MSDNGELQIGIGASVDQASIDAAKAAIAGIGGAFSKTFDQIERSKALDTASKSFAEMAVAENDAAKAAVGLAENLKALGATDAEIDKTVKAFDRQIEAIKKADVAAAQAAQLESARIAKATAAKVEQLARETAAQEKAAAAQAAAAQKVADRQIEAIKRADASAAKKAANDEQRAKERRESDEIEARAENARRDEASQGTGFGAAARVFGREVKALPSVQIGNTGVGTDSVAKIVGLSGALVDVGAKSSLVTAAATALTPALGAQAAATYAAYAPAAAFVVAFAAIGAAIAALVNETSKNVEKINSFATTQRAISDKVTEKATSKDVEAENTKLDERRKRETETLAKLQSAYDDSEKQARAAGEAQRSLTTILFGAQTGTEGLANITKIVSGDEQSLADQIAASKKIIDDTTAAYNSNAQALKDGEFAANDARAAEESLAKERTKNALAAADAAGRELAAQQKALASTEDQNKKRLESIIDEQAVAQKQIDVLTESGVTSTEVTDKIAALNAQLSGLGKESEFIKGTALAASRQADAAKKSQKDAEDAQKKAESIRDAISKSAENYATKQVDIARQSADKLKDIQQASRDKSADTDLKYYRDTVKLAQDTREKELDARKKFEQGEVQANRDTNRKLEDLRDEAIQSEQDALNSRNFLAAAKVREGLEKSNKDTLKEAERARDDRATTAQQEADDRYSELQKGRADRLEALAQERQDNKTAETRALRDAQIAKERSLNESRIAYDRELADKQAQLDKLLGLDQAFYAQQTSLAQAAANGGSTSAGISAASAPTRTGLSGPGPLTGSFGGLRPITNNSRTVTNQINISGDDTRVIRILRQTGVIPS